MNKSIADLRKEYQQSTLGLGQLVHDPMGQFEKWFDEAIKAEVMEPNAMTLATVGKNGTPSSRVLLLKGLEKEGFLFYTNYQSRKGRQISENKHAAMTFFWPELERQVRVEGVIDKISPEKSTAYFQSRPKGSQIGAWASPQSAVIQDRKLLEERVGSLEKKYAHDEVLPRPEQWGGYILIPGMVEFWQGRANRLHDRLVYLLKEGGSWEIKRLAP